MFGKGQALSKNTCQVIGWTMCPSNSCQRRRWIHLFHQERPSVTFFALLSMEKKFQFWYNWYSGTATSMLTSSGADFRLSLLHMLSIWLANPGWSWEKGWKCLEKNAELSQNVYCHGRNMLTLHVSWNLMILCDNAYINNWLKQKLSDKCTLEQTLVW